LKDLRDGQKDPSKTKTLSGELWKDSEIVECIGCIDEANAFLGLARIFCKEEVLRDLILKIQKKMFSVGCEVSMGERKIDEKDVEWIENTIKEIEKCIDLPKSFLILETSGETAFLNVARTVVRRAERRAVTLYKKGIVGIHLVQWLNKLSYLLYLMILFASNERIYV